ncbi:TetR/AcrR family transcriptional regulator [Desertihabitans aurantiacus]|uniref:TetR/AcrR family transcriptional regulator n=1 Tax=Desertihabitans aurantiacus TaxID=2282477 RepID=UPI000DF7E257|nr:TetR/AcrR family transcriptional regulator [Desertihabitans aurantiacus]
MPIPTRAALLAAATALLDEGGVEAVTLREVGRRAGVSHNAPYKHFADKSELLAEVAAAELDELGALLAAGVGRGTGLDTAVEGYLAQALRHPHRFQLVHGRWTRTWPVLEQAATRAQQRLLETVQAAQSAGELPAGSPARLAALLRATAHGAVVLELAGHLGKTGSGDGSAEALTPRQVVAELVGRLRGPVTDQ